MLIVRFSQSEGILHSDPLSAGVMDFYWGFMNRRQFLSVSALATASVAVPVSTWAQSEVKGSNPFAPINFINSRSHKDLGCNRAFLIHC
jgi:hypothetical protein